MEDDYLTDDDNIAIVVSYIRLPDDFPQEITDPKAISSYLRGLIDKDPPCEELGSETLPSEACDHIHNTERDCSHIQTEGSLDELSLPQEELGQILQVARTLVGTWM